MSRAAHNLHRRARMALTIIMVSAIALVSNTNTVFAYDCAANDCYGVVTWNGLVDGADARIRVTNNMSSTSSNTSWHINNILWVLDQNIGSQVCTVSGVGVNTAWVEVGMIARSNAYRFYWDDCLPNKPYRELVFGNVANSDKGVANYFEIFYVGNSSWYTSITAVGNFFSATSSTNTMEPDQIKIGIEAAGASGLHADVGQFTNNRYIHGPNRIYQFWSGSSYVTGAPGSGLPPATRWITVPAPGNFGGNWRTYCGC